MLYLQHISWLEINLYFVYYVLQITYATLPLALLKLVIVFLHAYIYYMAMLYVVIAGVLLCVSTE